MPYLYLQVIFAELRYSWSLVLQWLVPCRPELCQDTTDDDDSSEKTTDPNCYEDIPHQLGNTVECKLFISVC